MTKPIPRAILFAVLALIAVMALTLVWIVVDVVLSGGKVTLGVINRAMVFWVIAGAIIVFFAAARAASVPTAMKPALLGLLTGALLCAIELGVQLLSSPSSAIGLLAASLGTKLAASWAGGAWAGARLDRTMPDPS